jgi:RNA polymerase sigma-70 factor (ECF subfamily)
VHNWTPDRRLEIRPSAGDDADTRDATLASQGDAEAFARLYARHAARLHLLAKRMLGSDFADDALQDVFVHTWSALGQFRGDSRFGTWLYRLAVNIYLRQSETVRRLSLRLGLTDPDSISPRESSSLDIALDIDAALIRLAVDVRTVVLLHDVEGFGHDEIATTLGISTSASKMRLHRGRLQLREWLK